MKEGVFPQAFLILSGIVFISSSHMFTPGLIAKIVGLCCFHWAGLSHRKLSLCNLALPKPCHLEVDEGYLSIGERGCY